MKIITISGKAQNGKDYTAEGFRRYIKQAGGRVLVIHYADLLKHLCKIVYGWNGNKDESGRSMLQKIGTKVRDYDPCYWIDYLMDVLEIFEDEFDWVIIPDVRYPNEIEVPRMGWDLVTVKVERYDFDENNKKIPFDNGLTEEQKQHSSETALDDFDFDIVLENYGDDNYRRIVRTAIEQIMFVATH